MMKPRSVLALSAAAAITVACGATSPGQQTGAGGQLTTGIAVPQEISALPTRAATSSALQRAAPRQALTAAADESDYAAARTVKFVNEPALSQFDIFNTIFKALGQTHYADPENVGSGPYGAMVTWLEDHGDMQTKQVVPWVVDSRIVTESGHDLNRVQVWMLQTMGDGLPHVIKVELDIEQAPTQKADGSYSDYGVWRLNAKFDEGGHGYFAASASRTGDGLSVVMLHENEGPGGETRGILQKSEGRGSGRVIFPDYSSCNGPECTPEPVAVAYVYDADHVALQKGSDVVYKDRNSVVDLVNRYGLFDAETGADVAKTRAFGFPIRFTDAGGGTHFGYYGAWQGRHQLWTDGQQQVPPGTTVSRGDRPPDQVAEAFTVSDAFRGTLVKRTLVPADIQDVKGLAVETWVNQSFNLRWDGTSWYNCINPDYAAPQQPSCAAGSGAFSDFASLVVNPDDRRRSVNINRWDEVNQRPITLVYDPSGASGAGFYVATDAAPPMIPVSTGVRYTPLAGEQIWANINGSVYIQFDGTSWVQRTVTAFDETTWTPTFSASGDRPYVLDLGREYYINNPGANYVVKRTGASSYDVQIELQTVANPANATAFLPAGTVLKPQWGGDGASTFQFITDATSPNFLKLVYLTLAGPDATSGAHAGDVVRSGQWGLVAYAGGVSTGVQYNWDFPSGSDGFGIQQFLKRGDGTFVLLDDPIRLAPVTLTSYAGESKTLSLQFDGSWVSGLPDVFRDLQKNGFQLSGDLAAKVVVIPAGTEVVDADDASKSYLFKPLQMNEYLATISNPGGLDLAPAIALDLQAVPDFLEHHMGPVPQVPVKYSEGSLVR